MKKLILILITVASTYGYSSFCAGYQDGYRAGYCYNKFGCIEPIPPICPIPNIGESSYSDGYNRGFLVGLYAR